jgi:hypothetical protein
VRSVWRLIVLWRYLLAAFLVLAAGWWYMLTPLPDPVQDLWSKYEKVKTDMTGPQVEGIVGPPQQVKELSYDFQVWLWRAGGYTLWVALDRNDPPTVLSKNISVQNQVGQE